MEKIINTDLILEYLKKEKLSKTKFCKLCGINIISFNKILNNQMNYRTLILLKIARQINIPMHKIFNEKKTVG